MSSSRKIRAARLAAFLVQWGDVLVTEPADSRVIGTVLDNRSTSDNHQVFKVRTPRGEVIELDPVREERPVWVHVPAGSA